MEKSKVYFTDFRVHHEESLTHKLQRLLDKAGLGNIDMDGKYVAIKMHFGELGNLAFLRPNWAKAVADYVKAHGGKPFLTDCNTLYVGSRKNALDHLSTAYENGFSPLSTGCHVIIADGIKGTDEALVPVKGDYVKEAKIGQAIMDADIIISLNHFKGHESTGFGGAIKDLGMGCGSRAGKMEMHAAGKPEVDQSLCIGCGFCQKNCAHDAITIENRKATINHDKCVGCGRCIGACPKDATHAGADNTNEILNCKMAEYALAVVQGRPQFHINLVQDISPCCDCHGCNDAPILPDIGMFASADAVAIDQACADACLRAEPIPGTRLSEMPHISDDHFINSYPVSEWRSQLSHGEKIGLGQRAYELISMK